MVEHALFVIDLPDLGGADALRAAGVAAEALIDFAGTLTGRRGRAHYSAPRARV